METRNVSGDVLSNETFEKREELLNAFEKAVENKEVKTIKVTKNIDARLTDSRRNYLEKKLRKLLLKAAVIEEELKKG